MLRYFTSIMIMLLAAGPALAQDVYTIRQIQEVPQGEDISPHNGQNVITGGLVTVSPGIFHVGAGEAIYVEDTDGGFFSGISVYCPNSAGFPVLSVGDSVICQGTVVDDGMTQLAVTPGSVIFRSHIGENTPLTITPADIDPITGGDSLAERYEGVLVRLTNLYLDSVQNFADVDYWYCHDRTGHCIVKLESDSIPDSFVPPPGIVFSFIQGVIDQVSDHYVLKPRYFRDIRIWGASCIAMIRIIPQQPTSLDTVIVCCSLEDYLDDITLYYSAGGQWGSIPMNFFPSFNEYRANLGPFAVGTRVDYYICANDRYGTNCCSPYEAPFSFYSFNVWAYGTGSIAGTIRSLGPGPVRYPTIQIPNSGITADIDTNNNYLISGLPTGSYDLFCYSGGFRDTAIPNVPVVDGQTTTQNIALDEICDFVMGDANGNLVFNGMDIVYEVAYFKGRVEDISYPCYVHYYDPDIVRYVAGDITGDCVFDGSDIIYGVRYLKGGSTPQISFCARNGAIPPYGLVKGTVSWPGHNISQHVFVVADTILPDGGFSPWSRNLVNWAGQRDYNLLVSSAPRVIAIHAFDDVDTDGFWNPDAGDGWWFYDANSNGIWDIGDTLTIQPGQIIRDINIQLTPFIAP